MKKRDFLKTSILSALGATLPIVSKAANKKPGVYQHWIWIRPDDSDADHDIKTRFEAYGRAGVAGILFESDSEKHFKAAREAGIQAHRWIWTLNRGEASLLNTHPEWYAVNRLGDSCAEKPPYVNYYRWLCPSRPEVTAYLENEVKATLSKDYVDGIHLDYVRFCDVILPLNLWEKYDIVQTQELPQYDYCYCKVCQAKFREEQGVDISAVQYPDQHLSWRKFRYDRVNRLVNHLSSVAHSFRKPITAAVFPTPEVARRIVRQDWTNWNLNAVFPMIYHGFYKEDVSWIGAAVEEGIHFLNGKFPLYAGLYLPDFNNPEALEKGIRLALQNGASGVSLFGKINDDVLAVLSKFRK